MDEWVFMDILREALTNEVFGTLWAQFLMQHFIFNPYLHFSFCYLPLTPLCRGHE